MIEVFAHDATSYQWNTGESTSKISGLGDGVFSVTVTKGDGCSSSRDFELFCCTEFDGDEVNIVSPYNYTTNMTNPTSNSNPDGSISITVTDNELPVIFVWSGPDGFYSELSTIENLSNGDYFVTITDGCDENREAFNLSNCEIGPNTVQYTATIRNELTQQVGPLYNSTNINLSNGTVQLQITADPDALPLNYLWSNGSTNENLVGVSAGDYTVTITDRNGCNTIASFTVEMCIIPRLDVIAQACSNTNANNGKLKIKLVRSGPVSLLNTVNTWNVTGPNAFLYNEVSNSEEINLDNLEQGTYSYAVSTDCHVLARQTGTQNISCGCPVFDIGIAQYDKCDNLFGDMRLELNDDDLPNQVPTANDYIKITWSSSFWNTEYVYVTQNGYNGDRQLDIPSGETGIYCVEWYTSWNGCSYSECFIFGGYACGWAWWEESAQEETMGWFGTGNQVIPDINAVVGTKTCEICGANFYNNKPIPPSAFNCKNKLLGPDVEYAYFQYETNDQNYSNPCGQGGLIKYNTCGGVSEIEVFSNTGYQEIVDYTVTPYEISPGVCVRPCKCLFNPGVVLENSILDEYVMVNSLLREDCPPNPPDEPIDIECENIIINWQNPGCHYTIVCADNGIELSPLLDGVTVIQEPLPITCEYIVECTSGEETYITTVPAPSHICIEYYVFGGCKLVTRCSMDPCYVIEDLGDLSTIECENSGYPECFSCKNEPINSGNIPESNSNEKFESLNNSKELRGSEDEAVDSKEMHITVYPNPVTDKLMVEIRTEENSDLTIQLIDASGRLVKGILYEAIAGSNRLSLDTEKLGLPSGIAFVQIITKETTKVFKIAKLR